LSPVEITAGRWDGGGAKSARESLVLHESFKTLCPKRARSDGIFLIINMMGKIEIEVLKLKIYNILNGTIYGNYFFKGLIALCHSVCIFIFLYIHIPVIIHAIIITFAEAHLLIFAAAGLVGGKPSLGC
jgi:hypothetical protein